MKRNNLLKVRECRAISFDGDMTLWDFNKVMRHSLSKAAEHLRKNLSGTAVEQLTIDTMIELRNQVAASHKHTINLEEIRLQAFIHTLGYIGCRDEELAAELNSVYLKHRFEDTELYGEVKATLETLSKPLPCGLISNGNSYPERCGLAEVFSFIVFSQDVGVEKPDPAIFEIALSQLPCRAEQFVHVGDSLTSDVAGANAVGAVSIWLNRDGAENTSAVVPDFKIRTLDELLEILPT